jgi:hypothetical protein
MGYSSYRNPFFELYKALFIIYLMEGSFFLKIIFFIKQKYPKPKKQKAQKVCPNLN